MTLLTWGVPVKTMSIPTILVTRPSPAGEQLVNRLRTLGLMAYHAPLVNLSPGNDLTRLPVLLQAMQPGDLVFVLSQNAIRYIHPLLNRNKLSWPAKLTYYAIGRSTALALQAVSHLPVNYPLNVSTSEGLLALPELQRVNGKQALLLRGNGGRALLGETLIIRGAKVSYCECYQRNPVYYDAHKQSAYWQHARINTLVVTSGEMLQQLYTLIPAYYRSFWLLHCRMIVVSERLAAYANRLGWHDVRVAEGADNDALIRELQ